MTDDDRTARQLLSAAFEPGDETLGRVVSEVGAVEVVDALDAGMAASLGLEEFQRTWATGSLRECAASELETADQLGVRFVQPGDGGWPTQLDDLGARRPLLLRVMGSADLRNAAARSVGIVGSRAATRYGVAVADELAANLAGAGWCIVSGGAFGIDAASHMGTLAAGGVTIAISAAGADVPAPTAHTSLFSRIYDEGAVVSEVPLGRRPNRTRFLVRNRLIAALTRTVVVVEAAARSGALTTAREGIELGRVVAAVPGPITSPTSAGCHGLIRDHRAVLVTSAAQIAELMLIGSQADAGFELSEAHQLMLDYLPKNRFVAANQVAHAARLPLDETIAGLLTLESRGLACRDREGWTALTRPHHDT